jgi:hypothetical protein
LLTIIFALIVNYYFSTILFAFAALKAGQTRAACVAVGEAAFEEPEVAMLREDDELEISQDDVTELPASNKRSNKQASKALGKGKNACNDTTDLSFNAFDVDVLELLPAWIVQQFPFRATRRGALDLTVLELIKSMVVTEGSFAGVRKRLLELQYQQWYQQMLLYYTYADWLTKQHVKECTKPPEAGAQPRLLAFFGSTTAPEPAEFGDAANKDAAYSLYVPSAQYLSQAFLATTEEEQAYADKYMANLDGDMLKCDHTFEVCKSIRGTEHDQLFEAFFTVMNEYCQILGQWAVHTKSQAELDASLRAMAERFQQGGMKVNLT